MAEEESPRPVSRAATVPRSRCPSPNLRVRRRRTAAQPLGEAHGDVFPYVAGRESRSEFGTTVSMWLDGKERLPTRERLDIVESGQRDAWAGTRIVVQERRRGGCGGMNSARRSGRFPVGSCGRASLQAGFFSCWLILSERPILTAVSRVRELLCCPVCTIGIASCLDTVVSAHHAQK